MKFGLGKTAHSGPSPKVQRTALRVHLDRCFTLSERLVSDSYQQLLRTASNGLNKMNTLILIDIQLGFDNPVWGERNNPTAEERAGSLLESWRANGLPIVHIKHVSTTPGSPLSGQETGFKPEVQPLPEETVIEKSVNSAFIGTNLDRHLKAIGATDLTICGLTTPHCVSSTTRMAANMGYNVRLVADACAAFTSNADVSFDKGIALTADEIHRSALAHLHGEFAIVCLSAEVLEAT